MKLKTIFKNLFNTNPTEVMSFKQSMDLVELPIVTFYQGKKKFNFLLDTGSTDNVIDASILKQIKHEKCANEGTLTGLDNIKNKVKVCKINLSYKDKEYPYYYLIKDMSGIFGSIKKETGVTLHGIVGARFFNEFKYILDFSELIAYSKV